jgi:GTP-binding protein
MRRRGYPAAASPAAGTQEEGSLSRPADGAVTIKEVEFAGAIAAPGGPSPAGKLPQVAFSGRSNVGKSSLINRLLGRTRSHVARVSSRPGKTQEINFYHVRCDTARGDTRFFLVDLPGYGYAKAPEELRRRWRPLIEAYLSTTPELRGVVQLIDARRGPTPDDVAMVQYLASIGAPTLFALTKIDKLPRRERAHTIERYTQDLGVDADQVVGVSAVTGEGRELLLESLEGLLMDGGKR